MWRFALVLMTLSSAGALADDSGFSGVVAAASTGVDRPYADTRTDHSLAPIVIGRWRNVYFEGNRVTLGLHQGDGWSLGLVGQARLHQYHAPSDARRSLDAGPVVTVPVGAFTLQAAALRDISGAHGGTELELRGFRRWTIGSLTLVPSLALQRQDDRINGYYFGTRADTTIALETTAILALEGGWVLLGSVRRFQNQHATNTWAFGVGRTF